MEVMENAVTNRPTDIFTPFDLRKENINGYFSNLTLLSMVLMSVAGDKKIQQRQAATDQTFKDEYDYVIVGGGTAGSVLANRLTEMPCISVLLIEAGGEPPFLTEIPSFARLFYNSEIDWAYKTTPQKYAAFGHEDNRVIWNNGKTLGGSSVLNAMLYVRGNMRNYDKWAAEGAIGWSYNDVFPYFLKLEDNRNIYQLDEGYHRTGGPMTAEKINYNPEIKHPILEATASMGYPQVDVNGRRQTGIYNLQATVRNQQRCSTAKAYLEPARDRPNLDILTHAFARKILISTRFGENVAYGVEFDYMGKTWSVRAKREVIVSNGAVRTPQLLMLSGIGPRRQLEKFNIPVIADLPVGKNLQDHYSTNLLYTIDERIMPVIEKDLNPLNVLDYVFNRRGSLCAPNQVTIMAFLNGLNTSMFTKDFPRQELYFAEYSTQDIRAVLNLKEKLYEQVYDPYKTKPLYVCYSSLLQPYSRGEVTLNSTDPHDVPNINPRYYEDIRDLRDVVEGLKICNAVAKQPAMRQVQAQLIATQRSGYPNCKQFEGNEDKYLGCLALSVINTFWHFSGTARMGHPNDPRSVVDPELRVIGVKNLRAISAAVMPTLPSANTNVPTMMIAEKASDMLKRNIRCRRKQQTQWKRTK